MKKWSSLLGALGGVALLFALLSFLLQLFSSPVLLWSELWWTLGNLVLGVVLLGIALGTNLDALRERARSGEARRASRYGTSAVLGTALSIALLAMGAWVSTWPGYFKVFDFTETHSHSLSDQTRKVLEGLDRDVLVTGLYAQIAAQPVRELLDRYTLVSPRVKVDWVDPQAQPGRVADLKVDAQRLSGGLLHVQIGDESLDIKDPTEESLTNAIVKLTRLEQKKVYLLIGHNEAPNDGDAAKGNDGFQFAVEALRNEHYEVQPLLLGAAGDVPSDANVVIVAGATRPLHEAELKALERYVSHGGALLVLIDPRAQTNLTDLLVGWGVLAGDDVIIDRLQGMFGRPTTPFAAEYADHPITRDLRDAVLFHMARSVTPAPDAKGAIQWIARTSESSWAEKDLTRLFGKGEAEQEAGDTAGPVPVAVAGKTPPGQGADADDEPGGRIVVVGDSDFARNQLIGEYRNRDFFLNAVNWLIGDESAISIRPTPPRASRLKLTTEQFLQIRYLSLFVLPELIAGIGVAAWWWRRRAPGR